MTEAQFEDALIDSLCHGKLSTEEDAKRPSHIFRSRNWTYEKNIKTTEQLWDNFKKILEQHNQETLDRPLSYTEFAQVKREIEALTTPFKAGQFLYGLNGVSQVEVDLDDGRHVFLTVFDQSQVGAGSTVYQVVNQVRRPAVVSGKRDRRFDVTLLINGLPIIQIELKTGKRNVDEALNQMKQYEEENQYSDIFSTVQILVAMTENNTRYMARTIPESFNKDFAFSWQHFGNNSIVRRWQEFADTFLTIPMAHNMATSYMILDGTQNKESLKVMRPYQVAATEHVINAIKGNDFDFGLGKLGYVWHTTGSGKTITSFKTAWLASKLPNVDKVVFLVDRKALTSQTLDNYRAYDPESHDDYSSIQDTANTNELSRKLRAKDDNIIITSTQKMERLVARKNFKAPDRHFVFIVDEAHRSTGGGSFARIQRAFKNSGWIGYSGTPIFDEEAGRNSTPGVFGPCLHAYTIREAIADKNVLGFKVDFMTTITDSVIREKYLPEYYRQVYPEWTEEQIQDKIEHLSEDDMNEEVSGSFYDNNQKHVEAVVDNIMTNWKNRSADGRYNAILTTRVGGGKASAPMAMMYLREFMKRNEGLPEDRKLKVAATFSQDNSNGNSMLETNNALSEAMDIYNKQFGTHFDDPMASEYMIDLSNRLRKNDPDGKNLDLVIVVDQLLTGFDAPSLNTLYVDRTLRGAGLIQAYSRTNRLQDRQYKQFGQVVNFRWPKESERLMDQALATYANKKNASKTPVEQSQLLKDDKILARPFNDVLNETREMVDEIREKTDSFEHIPPSEAEQEHLFELLKKYNRQVALLKQYPMAMNDMNEPIPDSGYDYDDPEALVSMLGMSSDENQLLNTVITNELKERIARIRQVLPSQIDLEVELLKDVVINYDYLTKLLEDLLNQVHDNEDEQAQATKAEIDKFANGLEDMEQAREIKRAAQAILNKEFPPEGYKYQYPYRLTNSLDVVDDFSRATLNKKLINFRTKWGITEIVNNEQLKRMFRDHVFGKQDLDGNGQLTEILKEGARDYKSLSLDEAVQGLTKLKYRNSLRSAFYELADSLTGDNR